MIRLFVAIALPEPVRQRLTMLCAGVPGARWAKPENMHLTLRFIGEVDGATFTDIMDALGHVSVPRFPLQIDGVGQFGEKRRADLLWAGVRPHELLLRLQGKVENALQRLGFDPDPRKFHAHVTLGRLKGTPIERVASFLSGNGGFYLPPFEVSEYVLFSSFLSHGGAIYRAEATYRLG
ncbi:MAG TPA: RNA 2',3'-cyclic phosphodiesterase [Candidatus Cybelea sp.]|nr:RNA 2',3'-cyclic phosphodiesterase [Candidatus Cybelea sp.]